MLRRDLHNAQRHLHPPMASVFRSTCPSRSCMLRPCAPARAQMLYAKAQAPLKQVRSMCCTEGFCKANEAARTGSTTYTHEFAPASIPYSSVQQYGPRG